MLYLCYLYLCRQDSCFIYVICIYVQRCLIQCPYQMMFVLFTSKRRVPLVGQELDNFSEHPGFSGVRVSYSFFSVFCEPLFVFSSVIFWVYFLCLSSIYGFRFFLLYPQTLITKIMPAELLLK